MGGCCETTGTLSFLQQKQYLQVEVFIAEKLSGVSSVGRNRRDFDRCSCLIIVLNTQESISTSSMGLPKKKSKQWYYHRKLLFQHIVPFVSFFAECVQMEMLSLSSAPALKCKELRFLVALLCRQDIIYQGEARRFKQTSLHQTSQVSPWDSLIRILIYLIVLYLIQCITFADCGCGARRQTATKYAVVVKANKNTVNYSARNFVSRRERVSLARRTIQTIFCVGTGVSFSSTRGAHTL